MRIKEYLLLFIFSICFFLFTFNIYNDLPLLKEVDKIIEVKLDLPDEIFPINVKKEDKEEKEEVKSDYISVKNSSIYKNDNYRATLSISNTNFKEPIYQYSDNDYYLTHNGLGQRKSSGATYLDYRVSSSSKKILIYGHNNDSLTLPFSILENYNDKDYYKEHKYITLEYGNKVLKYEIFSIYVETDNWDYMKIKFTDKEWGKHINDLKKRSIYDTGVEVSSDDKILILQTCSKNKKYSSYKKKYLLVIGKLVEE